jgi:GAF domain-containing protein
MMDDKFSDGDSYTLINLAEKAVLTNNLNELAQEVFPEMTAITQSIGSFLYVDDARLLKPQLYPFQIPAEDSAALDDFCTEQYAWFVSQNSRYPLIVSADWYDGERFHLYPLWTSDAPFGMVGLAAQKEYISGRKVLWVRFLQLFSGMVNRLLDRQQSERQLSHLNAYLNVSSMLSQPLGLHEMLKAVLFCSMEVVSAEASSVLLLDDEKQNFLFYQAEGPAKPDLEAITFPVDKGLAGAVYGSQTPELINDVPNDPRFFGKVDSETGFVTRSMIAVPLTAGDERVGVLEVINKMSGEPFTVEEFMLLVSIADEIAFAIRNARFFEYVVDSYCLQRQGLATCRGCRRPLGSWTPCVKYREEIGL